MAPATAPSYTAVVAEKKNARKKLPYLNEIGLDHFYIGFEPEEIEDLKKLAKLPYCTFTQVKSGKDRWQGVYWSATSGIYFEMVKKTAADRYQLGLAFSANAIQYYDIRKIRKLFRGEEGFKTFQRLSAKGKPWFEGFFPKMQATSAIKTWSMHYHFCPRDRKMTKQPKPSVIERFQRLTIEAPASLRDDLKKSIYWAPIRAKRTRNGFTLAVRQKDQSEFLVQCRFNDHLSEVRLLSLEMQASPFPSPLPKLKHFRVRHSGTKLILERTRS